MYDHLGLRVKDLTASVALYQALLAPLGHVVLSQDATSAGFGPKGGSASLWLLADPAGGGAHVAFRAPHRDAVAKFHAAALAAGAKDNGKPGVRADYSPTYFASFVIDLDGNNLEAVCFTP